VSSIPPEYPSYPRSDPNQPYAAYPTQPGYHGPPPSKTMAGWALGLAIFPSVITWFISVALAISVIRDSRDGRDHGQRMAKAALIIVGVWVVVAVVVVVTLVATSAERDEAGRVTDGGRASVLDLRVGDCIAEDPSKGEIRTVELIECSQPHRTEVYAVFDLDGEFTTGDDVKQIADAGCYDRFKGYIGIGVAKTSLSVLDLVPLDAAGFRTDPNVTCLATAPEPLSGSMKGSRL
jgi:hypothetical protein